MNHICPYICFPHIYVMLLFSQKQQLFIQISTNILDYLFIELQKNELAITATACIIYNINS